MDKVSRTSTRYADQQYRDLCRCKSTTLDIFSRARAFHLSHDRLLEERTKMHAARTYQRLSTYERAYLRGMWDTLSDVHWQTAVEWRVQLDGKLIPGNDVPDGRWSDVVTDGGAHVYRDDPSKLFTSPK